MEQPIDFLAIGDLVTDAFIRLQDAHVVCQGEACELCMRWGDKIPYESLTIASAVGNGPNAAVGAARLGLSTSLRAYVGKDMYGKECLDTLTREHIATEYVDEVDGKKTNYHFVLWFESQRTILIKHEAFDYHFPDMPAPRWIYLSSVGENSLSYHEEIARKLEAWPDTKLAFQPGTYQIKFGAEALAAIYRRTEIFFCNKEEAEHILGKPIGTDMLELLAGIRALGPKIVVITDDVRGAHAADDAGNIWLVPRYPDPRPAYEITGAGDALASGTTAALALGLPLEQALLWGPTQASAVLQEIGAQAGLLTRAELEYNLQNPPAPFELKKLN